MKKTLILFLFISTVSFGQVKTNQSKIEVIEKELFKDLIEKKIQIIDVRTAEEFRDGNIKNAINIDFKSSSFIQNISRLDKKKPYLIYCKSGNRSGKASEIMDSLGFYRIYDLRGGYMNW
jgi:rhodanese-related sulfurtransferase|tara:strand:- start:237 stop:596 length:360 start_codon:yes stop_codon:yes gene_type:complete